MKFLSSKKREPAEKGAAPLSGAFHSPRGNTVSTIKALAAVAFSALAVGALANAGQFSSMPFIENPNPADYHLNPGEQLLMVVPSMEAANRYVPVLI